MTQQDSAENFGRVVVVDDRPEIRLLLRSRLGMVPELEVVGEASNGAEALILAAALAPDVMVLDLEMPVMRGDEAIPGIRQAAPGVRILIYSATPPEKLRDFSDENKPDALVTKGGSLNRLVDEILRLMEMGRHDVLRVALAPVALDSAVSAVDAWAGANVRILDALTRGDELVSAQLAGATVEELQALIGVYAHVGDNLRKAVRTKANEVTPVIHVFRTTAAAARRALLACSGDDLVRFYEAWDISLPESAVEPLREFRENLIAALPTSSADSDEGEELHVATVASSASSA